LTFPLHMVIWQWRLSICLYLPEAPPPPQFLAIFFILIYYLSCCSHLDFGPCSKPFFWGGGSILVLSQKHNNTIYSVIIICLSIISFFFSFLILSLLICVLIFLLQLIQYHKITSETNYNSRFKLTIILSCGQCGQKILSCIIRQIRAVQFLGL
jgi:hypothetical protein